MERNRDFRRPTVSSVNGLPRRRQRITTLRDSTDEDRQMELKETARSRDRERLQKKERDREFPKRRRVDRPIMEQRSVGGGDSYRENESTDSSDEEYCEEEEVIKNYHHKGTNQLSPASTSPSNNRRGLRTLRSSPVIRFPSDEIFGVPVPRRARSVSARRLQKCWISGSVGFGDDLSHRRFSPATVSPIGFGGGSPSSSSDSMKNKKMKSAEPRTRILSNASNSKPSLIQDAIEIEVVEALFDLMKQSHSQSHSSKIQEKVDRDSADTADFELQRFRVDGGEDGNNAFSIQNEQSKEANAEIIVLDSIKDLKNERRAEKEKFSDGPADELVGGDGFVNKGTPGSPKEKKSPSCVKVNACDIEDPTVTKAEHAGTVVEANNEDKLLIDLMASPPVSSSPQRDALDIEICPQVKTRNVQKDGPVDAVIPSYKDAIGALSSNQSLDLGFEKPRHTLSNSNCNAQQPRGQKEQKNRSSSLFTFQIGLSSWPGVVPHPGYMPPLQSALSIDGSARSPRTMRPPQFKLSLPRTKRCVTHQHIAHHIDHHQQLIKKSLSSEPTGPVTSTYGTESATPKTMLPAQTFTPGNSLETILSGSGKDKGPSAAAVLSVTTSATPVLQQASSQGPAKNLLHSSGFMFPLGHHHTSMMAPTSSSGPPQSSSAVGSASLSCNLAGKPSANLSFPGGASAVSFNHPIFPFNGTAPYMTILQDNGGPIPISTNIPMPSFKGGSPSMPHFNSSLYPSSLFNVNNQQQFSPHHAPVQSTSQNAGTFRGSSSRKQPECQQQTSAISENKIPTSAAAHPTIQPVWPSYSSGKSDSEIVGKSNQSVKSNNHAGSIPFQPMNFAVIPPLLVGGSGAVGNKNGDHSHQGPKGRVELSFGTNPSSDSAANFSSMVPNPALFHMIPDMMVKGTRTAQQKNFQSSEGKFPSSGDHTFNFSKSDGTDMSASSATVTSKFDGLSRGTVYFCPSSLSGNQPFQSSSAAHTSGISPTIPDFQQLHHQQQLTQLQQHHVHQMQLTGAAQFKPMAPTSIPGSILGSSLPSNSPVFSQLSAQPDISSKWMNFPRMTPPEGSTAISTLKSSLGQTHLSFGNGSTSAASLQGQQHIMIKGQPASSLMATSNPSLSKNAGSGLKAMPSVSALPSQETGTSPNGPSQKSPPACRRNIPSILSTCPSQLSELKY